METLGHFVGGERVAGRSNRLHDIYDPVRGQVQRQVSLATADEVGEAVTAAQDAFPAWAATNPQRRARVMFEFKRLVELAKDDLAKLLSSEHGKTVPDAAGDVQRGLEVIEFSCGIPHLQKGEYTEGAGPDIDVYSMRQPLGVCAGITPFNFPAMIPMWMFGPAIAAGNTFVNKPSEKDPSVPMRLAELFVEAGGPAGVLNVVNGDKEAVDAILEDPRVKAVSFVGSSDIASYIYANGTANGKRVQAFGGAKNHMIVMPDADMENAASQLIGSAYGSAGERCMATPVVVPVGEGTADRLIEHLKPKIEALRIGPSDQDVDVGPLVTAQHKERVRGWIDTAEAEGQHVLVDGREVTVEAAPDGYFLGATLLDHARPGQSSYEEEIFGPVLQIVRADTLEEAIKLPSEHQYGNGVAIFTASGSAARKFAQEVEVGMVGVNVPIPVPVAYHSFGGWKRSGFGDTNQHGPEGVRFWTKVKTVTQRWDWDEDLGGSEFVIPTMR